MEEQAGKQTEHVSNLPPLYKTQLVRKDDYNKREQLHQSGQKQVQKLEK